jgi:CheY-like chemotaxis protein
MEREILVVDDDRDVRDAIEQVLLSTGHRVCTAHDGRDALEQLRARRRPPDVILLDLMMPVMDGLRFREAQRRDRALADIPVVVISAVAEENAAALGDVAGLLPKPFGIDALLEALAHAADGARPPGRAPARRDPRARPSPALSTASAAR